MAKKVSASLAAAQAEYFEKNNIYFEKKEKKKTPLTRHITHETIPASQIGIVNAKDFGIYIGNFKHWAKLIDMEDKELVKRILSAYEGALAYIINPEIMAEPVKMKEYLTGAMMNHGICKFSRVVLGVAITERDWITRFIPEISHPLGFWCQISENCFSPKEMIKCISFRVEKLTEILNELNSEDNV